jgi:membrane protease YdiL (CAAX protease family)
MMARPSVRGANLLYLVCMALVVAGALVMQAYLPQWSVLLTELVLILLPVLIFLRLSKLPLRQTLGLHWPGWRVAGLSLLVGIGIWLLDIWLGVLINWLLQYTPILSSTLTPRTNAQAALTFVSLALAAPVCEEMLFRGVLLRAHERHGAWRAIVMSSVLFLAFHLGLQQPLALIPLAFGLGYVAWRTGSLIPAILVHLANNAGAALLAIAGGLGWNVPAGLSSMSMAFGGLILAMAGLWLIGRIAPPMPEAAVEPERSSWLSRAWPLALAALIYLFMAGSELVYGRFPELVARQPLELEAAPWQDAVRWRYEMRNPLDQPAGRVDCQLMPEDSTFTLDCHIQTEAFEVRVGNSTYYSGGTDERHLFRWAADDMRLIEAETISDLTWTGGDGQSHERVTVTPAGDELSLSYMREDDPTRQVTSRQITFSPETLFSGDWLWRLAAMPFQSYYGAQAQMAYSSVWSEEDQSNVSAVRPVAILVVAREPITVPAGDFTAWRVEVVGEGVAWYDVQPPHTLLRYEGRVVSWVLISAE